MGVAIATGLILLIPLIAMQFSEEVVWSASDFILMGILIFGTGFTYKFITRKSAEFVYRIAIGFALATGFFLVWSNLAVGIIGSENNVINVLYFGVIAVGVIGGFIVRFKSRGMTFVMFTMALAQSLIAAIALITGMQHLPESSVMEILAVNGFFIFLFVVSALLFRFEVQEQEDSKQEISV
jgi:hypothetical protein